MESANLKLSEGFEVPVDAGRVWSVMSDPATVVSCMPGAAITATHEDGSLEGTMVTLLGPTKVTFHGTVLPEFDEENYAGHLRARGGDARGRTKAVATTSFRLSSKGTSHTRVDLEADMDVTGGLAPFVRTGGQHLVRRMLEEFSLNLAAVAGAQDGPHRDEPARPVSGFRLILATLWDVVRDPIRRLSRPRKSPNTMGEKT